MQPSNSPDYIQKEYLRTSKVILTLFTLNSLALLAACIVSAAASSNLSNDSFLGGLQETTLVFSIITAILVFLSIVAGLNSRVSPCLRITGVFLTLVFLAIMIGLLMGSLFSSLFDEYCGYFISHNGDCDGSYIANALQSNYQYPSCYSLQNDYPSVENQINVLSVAVITSYCSMYTGQTKANCMDLSSLSVSDWSSVFSNVMVALIMASVGFFIFIVFAIMVSVRIRNVKNNVQSQTAALLQNQIASQQQYLIVQPVVAAVPQPQQQQQYIPQGVYQPPQGAIDNRNQYNPGYQYNQQQQQQYQYGNQQQQQYGAQYQQQPYNPYGQPNNQQ